MVNIRAFARVARAARVLDYLVGAGRLTPAFKEDLLGWRHTGFSVDASVRVPRGDHGALGRLLRYVARPPISNERLRYEQEKRRVTILSANRKCGARPVDSSLPRFAQV